MFADAARSQGRRKLIAAAMGEASIAELCCRLKKKEEAEKKRKEGGGGKGGEDATRVLGNILSLFHVRVGLSGLRLES
ncbi:hypothetical protein TIFTF001_046529 [Ficus carica]|uniref:Uncharacterized protein n=1 Tax=Ficus carica TaxID=3494 RepID=A0AA88CTZ3_FICCA|nr:hypothetical protein TIFTF001_046529 [Ficus carica]